MAKKKADSPAAKPKSASKAKATNGATKPEAADKVSAAKAPAAKKPAAKKSAPPARPLTGDEIGLVAGDVWSALSANGGLTLAELKKAVAAPEELVLAAIGWLAREHKLAFDSSGRSVTVSLA